MERYPEATVRDDELEEKAAIIERTLASFRVEATVREINPGPAITQFALEPGVGVKVRRVTELHNDLALALAVPALRIEAPIPSKSRIGIEIPNAEISVVGLRDTLESPDFVEARAKLPVPLGRDVNGRYQVADLARMPPSARRREYRQRQERVHKCNHQHAAPEPHAGRTADGAG